MMTLATPMMNVQYLEVDASGKESKHSNHFSIFKHR